MQPGWSPPRNAPPPGSQPPGGPPPGGPPPPGWFQGPDGRWYPAQPVQQKSNSGLILGLALGIPALLALIAVVCILAITFLGTSASVKFSSIGTSIDDSEWPTTSTTERSRRTTTTDADVTSEAMTPQAFEDELVAQGLPGPLASCIVDALEAEAFDFRTFGDLTAAEEAIISEATTACVSSSPAG